MVHYHVLVWAYDERQGDDFRNVRKLDLIVENLNDEAIVSRALERAKVIFPGRNYDVRDVIQHDGTE